MAWDKQLSDFASALEASGTGTGYVTTTVGNGAFDAAGFEGGGIGFANSNVVGIPSQVGSQTPNAGFHLTTISSSTLILIVVAAAVVVLVLVSGR